MANNGIKGITIALGADTSGLDQALKGVNKQSKELQSELKEVEKALKWDPGNIELVAQKQQILAQSVQQTTQKLETLKTAQQQVEQQFQSGQIGEEQYRAFQRELVNTESELRRLEASMTGLSSEQERLGQTTNRLNAFFDATGTNVEQFADTLGTRLTQAIRDGSASSDQMEKALRLMSRQALGANTNMEELRRALNRINDGGSLDEVRTDLDRIRDSANQAETDVKGFGDSLSGVVGGLVAGGGLAGIVEKALDTSSLNTKIDITLDLDEESAEVVRQTIKNIEAYGVDGEAALEGVRKQWALNSEATDEANAKIIEAAGVIAGAYSSIDFSELIQESNEISKTFGITNEEALALTDSLLKVGFPPEQLDIISEYGNQLSMAGFNAEEIQAIMAAGVDTGTWNIDNLLDGVKEGRIKLAEFGATVDDATKKIIEGTGISAKQLDAWGDAVAAGGTEGTEAMQEVAKALEGVKDKTKQNELGVLFFGTLWEEQGTNITDTLLNMGDHMTTTKENQEQLNESIDKMNSDPAVQMQQAMQDMMTALQPLLTMVAEFVTKISEWISENPKLAAVMATIGTVVGILVGAFALLMPAISAAISLWPVLSAAIGAISAPIAIAIAAIVAIIAIGVALWKNWDEIKAAAGNLAKVIGEKFGEFKDAIKEKMEAAKEKISEIWGKIQDFFNKIDIKESAKRIFETFIGGIKDKIEKVVSTAKDLWAKVTTFLDGINIIETGKKIFSTFITGIGEKISDVTSKVKELWEGAKSFLEGIDLFTIGKNIIQGLIDGIGSMKKFVKDIIEKTIGSAIDFAKKLLGIASPSKVFFEIGEWTNEGFINGINASSKRLTEAVGNVYGSLASSTQKSMANASYYNTSSSIVNNNNKTFSPIVNINSDGGRADKAMDRTLRRLAFQFN